MATTTPNFGWPVPTSSDLVKNGAVAIEALGDAIDASLLDLKGGTTNQVLAKNSNTDMDFKWVTSAGGGKVLQVVSATNTATQSSASTSFVDAITVSITPSANTSKVLVMGFISGSSDGSVTQIPFRLARGSTGIFVGDSSGIRTQATGLLFQPSNSNYSSQASASFLDSPATTSATTYRVQFKNDGGSGTAYLGQTYNDVNAAFTLRTPSAGIIVMEIGA